jgi:membrane protease YdiL (CAAX protease family)
MIAVDGQFAPLPLALAAAGYGFAILVCELLTVLVDARWGLVGYALVFLATTAAAVGYAALDPRDEPASSGPRPEAPFFAALATPPVLRLVYLAAPFEPPQGPALHAFVAVPALLIVGLAIRATGFSARTLGLRPSRSRRLLVVEALVIAAGIGFGYLNYLLLHPDLPSGWAMPTALPVAFAVLAAEAIAEELLFRGLLLPATSRLFGPWVAVAYVTAIFAVLHLGYRSLPLLLVVGAMGGLFALVVLRTRSLYGVILAHAAASFGLLVGFPWLFQG